MVKMKKEEIDNIIAESFIETKSCDIWQAFLDNMDNLEASLKKDNAEFNDISIMFAAAIQTALISSINTMREVLYKLCCEDDETENTDEVSEMTTEE